MNKLLVNHSILRRVRPTELATYATGVSSDERR